MKTTPVIALLSALSAWFFPWWSIAIVAGLVGYIANLKHAGIAYAAGFAGTGLSWGIYISYLNFQNKGLLLGKIAEAFSIPESGYLITLSIFIGSLVGGMGCVTGVYFRRLIEKVKTRNV